MAQERARYEVEFSVRDGVVSSSMLANFSSAHHSIRS